MKRLCFPAAFFLCMTLAQNVWASISTVRIYAGDGASQASVKLTKNMIERHASPMPEIRLFETLSELVEDLRNDNEASLLVMPGGSVIKYEDQFTKQLTEEQRGILVQAFQGEGKAKLSYLGIGAGAYFAATNYKITVNFGDERFTLFPERFSKRLNFFDFMESAFDTYAPVNYEGALSPEIELSIGLRGRVLWNGGPAFSFAYTYIDDSVALASYNQTTPAIVGKKLCEGSYAVVSGVHFEFDPFDVKNDFAREEFPERLHQNLQQGSIAKLTAFIVLRYLGIIE